jgi:hypothetical protein
MEEMVDSLCVDVGRSSDETIYDIFLLKEKFCEIRTILSTDASDECDIHFRLIYIYLGTIVMRP